MRLIIWLWQKLFGKNKLEAVLDQYGVLNIDLDSGNYIKITDATALNGYRRDNKDRHDPEFLEYTDVITAELGKSFGISFYVLVNNSHKEVDIELTTRIIHPKLTNPVTGKSAEQQTDTFIYTTPYYQYLYATFEYDYERVNGTWVFQVWKGQQLMLEKSFEVYWK